MKPVAESSSQDRVNLAAELRRLYANMRPPRNWGVAQLMDMEITISQLRAMFLLLDASPARMSFIAQEMGITLSACTHLIDRLVMAGYVERSEDPADRRVVQCSLTGKGRDVLDRLRQQSPVASDEFIERLSTEELKIMIQGAQIYQRVMAEMDS